MKKLFTGGWLVGYRTYIISGIGILSAAGAYIVGDTDVFGMLSSIFTLGAIYFLRAATNTPTETINKTKENKNANTRKVSK